MLLGGWDGKVGWRVRGENYKLWGGVGVSVRKGGRELLSLSKH